MAALAVLTTAFATHRPVSPPHEITVWKSPSCGCCGAWVAYMREHGFKVTVVDMNDVSPVKRQHKVPETLWSCHTAVVDGYVIEGHVPAPDIERLLREHPNVAGLAVPGMVTGSPGMESGRAQAYDVVSFGDAKTQVYAHH
ncbi:MAG TPA: DUF411 domain-containing protein [Gemmatimonadales bacterium]|nr:DUF411 domain-containing protein [Gemmatimonadales bacterium]